ncbi:stage III sporulation protein AB [Salimicrobium halophilum]|uniref:Stage III sporulation protein AB n=1 Tax=Salimicrobium halophilum TaxID=86666 RepID=A0A1G8PUK2_9BACI|nr:stage III sporulation protein AB [Salimicrobium halophilum]SDI96038.1 stage III sporulation protein AB [Salimicrobium halophilum]
MMSSIGSLLILSVTTFFGFGIANNYEKRPKYLREWKYVLSVMETEIIHGHSSIEHVCAKISTQKIRLSSFFASIKETLLGERNFSLVWEKALSTHETSFYLQEEDLEILKQLGQVLGKYSIREHQKHFSLTQHHLEEQYQQAVKETEQYRKMARGLGVLSGCLIVLLLI